MFFASSLVLNIIIARYYQASLSGWIYYVINFYTFILLLLSFSLESGMGYYVSKQEISPNKLLNFSVLWTAIAGVFVLVLFYWRKGSGSADMQNIAIAIAMTSMSLVFLNGESCSHSQARALLDFSFLIQIQCTKIILHLILKISSSSVQFVACPST